MSQFTSVATSWALDGANTTFAFAPPKAGAAAPEFAKVRKGKSGTDKMNGTSKNEWFRGLGGDDALVGKGGHDKLDGGSGSDILSGGSGNDTLIGGSGKLDILDGASGNDLISGGIGMDMMDGGAGNDVLSGGGGADWIFGGKGQDTLSGGSGKDLFSFDARLSTATNIDLITDYSVKHDTIVLYRKVFTKAGSIGDLKSKAFWKGASAHDRSDRIIYDPETGALYYDRDGSGAAAQVQFAQLKANLALTYKDFAIL